MFLFGCLFCLHGRAAPRARSLPRGSPPAGGRLGEDSARPAALPQCALQPQVPHWLVQLHPDWDVAALALPG
eukprot:2763992-Pyramimonas_sp.AAC.1